MDALLDAAFMPGKGDARQHVFPMKNRSKNPWEACEIAEVKT
jgi:hypothetical protein